MPTSLNYWVVGEATETVLQRSPNAMKIWSYPFCLLLAIAFSARPVRALPPTEDIPEEVLRTEIVTDGRSPFDGQPLTPGEYALLEERLRQDPPHPQVNPKVEELVYLIRLRKLFRSIGIPIK